MLQSLGFRVQGLGCRVFRVRGLGLGSLTPKAPSTQQVSTCDLCSLLGMQVSSRHVLIRDFTVKSQAFW